MAKQMSFVAAMRDYFGLRSGDAPHSFLLEMKALADEDTRWFSAELTKLGYEIPTSPHAG